MRLGFRVSSLFFFDTFCLPRTPVCDKVGVGRDYRDTDNINTYAKETAFKQVSYVSLVAVKE